MAPSTDNPRWHPPPPGEAITWWKGRLVFERCTSVEFLGSGAAPAIDANDEVDFGYIDSFVLTDTGFELDGEWGT